jgi:hypothetical protein
MISPLPDCACYQTVIFDSCHSGGIARNGRVARSVKNISLFPEDLDKNIWAWNTPRTATAVVPTGSMYEMMASHVLLAACRQGEVAWECLWTNNMYHGAFTASLIKTLCEHNLSNITYSTLLDLLPALEHQYPQCEGKHKARTLFNGAVGAHQTTYSISMDGAIYRANAGQIHGVVKGTPFAIYAHMNVMPSDPMLGILEADSIVADSCTLRLRSGDVMFNIPAGSRALMPNWRQDENVLKVFVEPPFDGFQSIEHVFSLVNSSDSADLVVRGIGSGALQLERLDPFISKYARVLNGIQPDSSLSDMLQGVSYFNFHLLRRNSLRSPVKIILHRLTQNNPDDIWEEPIYIPDGESAMSLDLKSENTVFVYNQTTAASRDDCVLYGLTVENHSDRELFPYLTYFDPSKYSIQVMPLGLYRVRCFANSILQSWYHPPSESMSAPLAARHEDGTPSKLPVGYGAAGGQAIEFLLSGGVTSDVGFLKLFVSTTYVDMTNIQQTSPLLAAREGPRMVKPPAQPIWDAWTYVLRTESLARDP